MSGLPSWVLPVLVLVVGIILSFFANLVTNDLKVKRWVAFSVLGVCVIAAVVLVVVQLPAPAQHDPLAQGEPPSSWRLLAQQDFTLPNGSAASPLNEGCTASSAVYTSGRLEMRLDSCIDYTYQVAFSSLPISVGSSYYISADVDYASGPTDGYCGLLTGWKDSEHYYAFKINRNAVEVTRDKGGLPHQALDGPTSDSALQADTVNQLAVFSNGSQATFSINGYIVSQFSGLQSIDGSFRLAAQAANGSDLVTCTFDNIKVWSP